jgi:SulP family sulfate permease
VALAAILIVAGIGMLDLAATRVLARLDRRSLWLSFAVSAGVLVYRLYAPLVFANARHVAERLRGVIEGTDPAVRCLVLDMQAVTHVDVTAAEVLVALHDELQGSGVDVRFARANRPLREQLTRWLEGHEIAHERFFPSAHAAVDDFLAATGGPTRG